eukprot:869759_1
MHTKNNNNDEKEVDSCVDNKQQLLQLLNEQGDIPIDSTHLLQPLHGSQETNDIMGGMPGIGGLGGGFGGIASMMARQNMCADCNLNECQFLNQIICVLSERETETDESTSGVIMHAFQHLLLVHNDRFETIHNILTTKCNNSCVMENCAMVARNARDRGLLRNDDQLSKLYRSKNTKDIVRKQIIDTIHCHYFHTFDIGYRLRQDKINEIQKKFDSENEQKDGRDIVVTEMNKYICDLGSNDSDTRRKFVTAGQEEDHDQKTNDVDKGDHSNWYSFGYRFFYWDWYKNNDSAVDPMLDKSLNSNWSFNAVPTKPIGNENKGYKLRDWYIHPLFGTLKEELINNKVCDISKTQWDIQYEKAVVNSNSDRCKLLKVVVDILDPSGYDDNAYGLMKGSYVTIAHIMAMLMYCNYSNLQNQFSKTYRKVSPDETDESLKKRHSNYYHLGRLLRELVDCYGTSLRDIRQGAVFYHGISMNCQFKSIATSINGPFSTSLEYAVAVRFSQNEGKNGMILALKLDNEDNSWIISLYSDKIAYFDCHWLSDYPNEREVFFIGGHGYFAMQTIIETLTARNYVTYMNAIGKLTCHLANVGSSNWEYVGNGLQMQYRILSHCLHILYPDNEDYAAFESLPKYVEKLFLNHLSNMNYLEYRLIDYGEDNVSIQGILNLFFVDDDGCLRWEIILKLFAGVAHLAIRVDEKVIQNPLIFASMFTFLKKNEDLKLKWIRMRQVIEEIDFGVIVSTYSEQFKQINWKMNNVRLKGEPCECLQMNYIC